MATAESPNFGLLLKRYRRAAGLTQEELAEHARLSPRAISDLERGARRSPRRDTVDLLATALGLAPAERAALEGAATRRRGPHPAPRSPSALQRSAAPPSAVPGGRLPVPVPPTPLIGRTAQVAAVVRLLRQAEVRLLTLTGPGGVGKTRLALAVAAALEEHCADGVIFVPLAALRDPALVLPTLALELGLREADNQPLQEQLADHLRDREVLLLLDNCEHLLAAAPHIADLLAACPRLKVLATSRAALRLRGEREVPVEPLALPDPVGPAHPETVAQAPAVQFFVQRAQDSVPDFALTPATAAPVAAICTRLDGLPLALELAAARIKLLPPPALLARLESRLQLLTAGPRDLPERQQTLRRAIGWSYDLLHPGEQALFRRLAVFSGGCTLDAAEAVCRPGTELQGDMLEWLGALLDKSLLRREEQPDGEVRFTMLETIREYGLEQLGASREAEVLRQRHATYYVALAEAAEPQLVGPAQAEWLERLEREQANLRAALTWAQENVVTVVALRLAGALQRFWWVRGYLREGLAWLQAVLALPDGSDGNGSAASPAQAARAKALYGAAWLAYSQGHLSHAQTLAQQSVALCQERGDTAGLATALTILGQVAMDQGDYERAVSNYERSLAVQRAHGDTAGIASVLNYLGLVAMDQADHERATALLTESLALYQALGDSQGQATVLNNLGEVARYQGDDERAAALYEHSLALRRDLGDTRGVAVCLLNLGFVASQGGDAARARSLFSESLALQRDVGDRFNMAYALEGLAVLAGRHGDAARAAQLGGAAAAVRAAIGGPLRPNDQTAYDAALVAARTAVGQTAFSAAWAAGSAMTLERAITYALDEPIPARKAHPEAERPAVPSPHTAGRVKVASNRSDVARGGRKPDEPTSHDSSPA